MSEKTIQLILMAITMLIQLVLRLPRPGDTEIDEETEKWVTEGLELLKRRSKGESPGK